MQFYTPYRFILPFYGIVKSRGLRTKIEGINRMKLYVIKECNTELYVTRNGSLQELGIDTRLFSTKADAMRAIEYNDSDGFNWTPIVDNIAWSLLEGKYGIDRWHLNIPIKELKAARRDVKLKVVRIELNELE